MKSFLAQATFYKGFENVRRHLGVYYVYKNAYSWSSSTRLSVLSPDSFSNDIFFVSGSRRVENTPETMNPAKISKLIGPKSAVFN